MLVVCPECGAEISHHAEICIKCGFPLEKFMEENGLDDFEHIKICPKCGTTSGEDSDCISTLLRCDECGTIMAQTDIPCGEFDKNCTVETVDEYTAEIANKYGGNQFQQEMYDEWASRYRSSPSPKPSSMPTNQPHCPYCNSTNVAKVSGTSRLASTFLFGIGSKKVGKQWKCNSCKSYF